MKTAETVLNKYLPNIDLANAALIIVAMEAYADQYKDKWISVDDVGMSEALLLREAANNYANDIHKVIVGNRDAFSFIKGAEWQKSQTPPTV